MKAHPAKRGMTRVLASAMALAILTGLAWAGAVGGEFHVNMYTTDNQERPSAGMDPWGNAHVMATRCRMGEVRDD